MTRPVRVQNDQWDQDLQSDDTADMDTDYRVLSHHEQDKHVFDFKFKICLLGESGVGKTSLIKRFINNKFNDNGGAEQLDDEINFNRATKPTLGLDCMTTVRIMRGHKIAIEIWDTAGTERFNALTTSYLRSANAILLVYDITDRLSFEALEHKWLEFVKANVPLNAYGGVDARLAIIANKLDLNDERVVPKKDGVRLATVNYCRFYEASAKQGRNVRELFRSTCDSICDYWCDLRGNPNFFPADVDTKNIRLNDSKQQQQHKTNKNESRRRANCVKC